MGDAMHTLINTESNGSCCMQTHGVTVRNVRVLRGPNVYAHMPVLHVIMDIGPYEDRQVTVCQALSIVLQPGSPACTPISAALDAQAASSSGCSAARIWPT